MCVAASQAQEKAYTSQPNAFATKGNAGEPQFSHISSGPKLLQGTGVSHASLSPAKYGLNHTKFIGPPMHPLRHGTVLDTMNIYQSVRIQ